ncbi:hypothetical protein BGC30_03990 [Novacetimonas hansenii]|nr:hypothetical protein BGC30_03990 [Novacetimonas hansenii]
MALLTGFDGILHQCSTQFSRAFPEPVEFPDVFRFGWCAWTIGFDWFDLLICIRGKQRTSQTLTHKTVGCDVTLSGMVCDARILLIIQTNQ